MNPGNGLVVFETLLKDNIFFPRIDEYIQYRILETNTFQSKDIPSLIFIISTLLTTTKKYIKIMKNIKTVYDYKELYYHISKYIENKINEVTTSFDCNEFIITYDTCVNLVLMYYKYPK